LLRKWLFDARRSQYGFWILIRADSRFSAGFFIPTSLAAVARIGFRTRGQQPGSGFYSGGGCFSMGIPCPPSLHQQRIQPPWLAKCVVICE
jgi:hypothetical protein